MSNTTLSFNPKWSQKASCQLANMLVNKISLAHIRESNQRYVNTLGLIQ